MYGGWRLGAVGCAVTTVRKIVSILLSFLIFPKPFTMNYVYGVIAFFLSFIFNMQVVIESNRQREVERRKQVPSPVPSSTTSVFFPARALDSSWHGQAQGQV
jgi:hypothetical protein